MMNEVLAFVVGLIAPFLVQAIKKIGITGIGALWATYAVSVALAVGATAVSGELNLTDVSTTVGIVLATAQTVYEAFIKNKE